VPHASPSGWWVVCGGWCWVSLGGAGWRLHNKQN